jgi:hypothetical protein
MACKFRRTLGFFAWAWIAPVLAAPTVLAQNSGASDSFMNREASTAQEAQQTSPQSVPSDLAAAAKLAREQRAAQSAHRTERSQAVNEMAGDLAREQDEPLSGAPTGYRYYYFKPGDYAILVPVDAKPVARDSYGLRLRSAEALTSSIEVILGEPIVARGDTPEEQIHNANEQYFQGCGLNLNGLGLPIDGHPASSAGYNNCSIGQEVLGSAELVLGDGYVVPVICGYPFTPQDLDPRPNQPIKGIVNKYDRERNGWNVCKLILPSLHFHPYGDRWNPKSASQAKGAWDRNALIGSGNTPSGSVGEGQSLGAFARANKKVSTREAMTELRHVSAGYNSFSYRYFCLAERACYAFSLQIPITAKKNEQYLNPYIGLFQFEVPYADSVAVIQATTGPPSESGIVSREEMIKTKANWFIGYVPADRYSGVGPGKVLSETLTEVSGIPTRLAAFRNTTASGPVLTFMASYMAPGKFVHVRCTVPEKVSGDLQGMCETVLRSLEVPMAKKAPADADNPPEAADPSESTREEESDDH